MISFLFNFKSQCWQITSADGGAKPSGMKSVQRDRSVVTVGITFY